MSTKKSNKIGSFPFGYAKNAPPPPGPVRVNSDTIDVNTAPTAASKALPPHSRISLADCTVVLFPAAIDPNFIVYPN